MANTKKPLAPEDRFDGVAVAYGAWMEHRRKKRARAEERFLARQAKETAIAKIIHAQNASEGVASGALGQMENAAIWMAAATKTIAKDIAKRLVDAIRGWRATLAILVMFVVFHALALAFFDSSADSLLWVNTIGAELSVPQPQGSAAGGLRNPAANAGASVARVLAAVSDPDLGHFALKTAAGSSWALADKFDVLERTGTRAVSDCLDAGVCRAMNAIGIKDSLFWQAGRPPSGMPAFSKKDAKAWKGSGEFRGKIVFVVSWGYAVFVSLMFGVLLKKTASRGAPKSVARISAGLASAQAIAKGMGAVSLALGAFVVICGTLGDVSQLWPSSPEQAQSLLNQKPGNRLNPGAIEWARRRPAASDWENRDANSGDAAIAQACKMAGFCGDEKTARSKEAQSGLNVSQAHASASGVWADVFRWAVFFAAFVVWPVLLLAASIANQDNECDRWEKRIKSWGREGHAHAERQRLIQALPAMTTEQKTASVGRKSHRI